MDREEPGEACLIKVLSTPHCFWIAQQTLVYQHLFFSILLVNCLPSSLWIPRPLPLFSFVHNDINSSFCPTGISHVYVDFQYIIKFDFLFLIFLHVNLILRLAQEPWRVEGKFSSPIPLIETPYITTVNTKTRKLTLVQSIDLSDFTSFTYTHVCYV